MEHWTAQLKYILPQNFLLVRDINNVNFLTKRLDKDIKINFMK